MAEATHLLGLPRKHKPKDIQPQGEGSGLDADKVDGLHASELGGGGLHASSHESGGGDLVHFADLEHDEGDAALHDAFTNVPHISQADKDRIHDRQHALSSSQDHTGEITDVQHGVRTLANAHAHGDLSGIGPDDHHAKPVLRTVEGASDTSTTSTSYVDLANMSISFDLTESKKVYVVFMASIVLSKTGEDYARLQILIDDVTEVRCIVGNNREGTANWRYVVAMHTIKTLSAGSHTVKVQWCTQAGNSIMSYAWQNRVLSVLEFGA